MFYAKSRKIFAYVLLGKIVDSVMLENLQILLFTLLRSNVHHKTPKNLFKLLQLAKTFPIDCHLHS